MFKIKAVILLYIFAYCSTASATLTILPCDGLNVAFYDFRCNYCGKNSGEVISLLVKDHHVDVEKIDVLMITKVMRFMHHIVVKYDGHIYDANFEEYKGEARVQDEISMRRSGPVPGILETAYFSGIKTKEDSLIRIVPAAAYLKTPITDLLHGLVPTGLDIPPEIAAQIETNYPTQLLANYIKRESH